jgi:hypothetical protein
VTIVTDAFRSLATAQAQARGRADLALVVVSHPVGGLQPDELELRITEAVGQLGDRRGSDR